MNKTYPRPQFERENWNNLNGPWQFTKDPHDQGLLDKWYHLQDLPDHELIEVPFAPQSTMSGVEGPFPPVIWYKRDFTETFDKDQSVLLHFGAVDHAADVYIDGEHIGTHTGGNVSFAFDITHALNRDQSTHTIHVRVFDDIEDIEIPRGKQYWKEESESIFYTPTSGIWQTVWLEKVPRTHLEKVKYIPDILHNTIKVSYYFNRPITKGRLKTEIWFENGRVLTNEKQVTSDYHEEVHYLGKPNDQDNLRLWTPENPNIYDVTFTLSTDDGDDVVRSYFGMRKISIEKDHVMLNNKPYSMRLVLDQGYYPESLMTSPSDEAIKTDINLTKLMGFNGVRKHQKIEEERYLYYADKMGLLVWEEMPSAYKFSSRMMKKISEEWQTAIDRDFNHPSIIAWVPFNESWGVPNLLTNPREVHFLESMHHLTKAKDNTRLVISNDGWEQGSTDLLTIHDYESDYETLKRRYHSLESILNSMPADKPLYNKGFEYGNEPILITEFGGISYKASNDEGWGYSNAFSDEDFVERLRSVFQPLHLSKNIQGFCYTQLTDIEQEMNGLLTYDRKPKIDIERIRAIVLNEN